MHSGGRLNRIIKRALAVAIPYSLVATVLFFSFTLQYVAVAEPGGQVIYRGLEAVKYIIATEGWASYALGMSRHFELLFVVVLFALLIHGYVYHRESNA